MVQIILKNILAWIASLTVLVPLALVVLNAFKADGETISMTLTLPKTWVFSNFSTVIEKGKLVRSFVNSMIYAGAGTILTVFFGALAAYVFSRRRSKGMYLLYMYVVLGMVIPINYVTLTKTMINLRLTNTSLGIILLYMALQTPFTVFVIYGFVSKIPVELDEAAIIDGCSPIQLYTRIVFPMLKSAIVTSGVLCFLNCWNEFMMPLYFLHTSDKWPMTLAVYNFFGQYEMKWNLICADVLLTCLPVIIIYLLGQKYIIGGQTAGAVKG
ncbi:MAG: carbohydrate ABC transporter permease [Lachnospiraceae bacterium]|nr:carbohydrate ABC transporter permease [Lachnospiraceae bacterium]MBR2276036.1 carbohydrate ABC transporter permease [Lachnospiraceae bacterium]